MNLNRIKQLYRRRDRLQELIDAQSEEILTLARQQRELERKAYGEVFGPMPERDAKAAYGGSSYWEYVSKMGQDARHLNVHHHLRLGEWGDIETWSHGCRGGSDERESGFKLDERMATEEGQKALYEEFVAKYAALKAKQTADARTRLEAQRRDLEKQLRSLGDAE